MIVITFGKVSFRIKTYSSFVTVTDGSKMDTAVEGSKTSKEPSSKQDMNSNGDIDDRDNRELIVDDDVDDDKLMEEEEVEEGGGRLRVVREQERRYANNARERYVSNSLL